MKSCISEKKDSKFNFNFDFVSGTISKLSDDGGSEVNGHSDKVNLTFPIFQFLFIYIHHLSQSLKRQTHQPAKTHLCDWNNFLLSHCRFHSSLISCWLQVSKKAVENRRGTSAEVRIRFKTSFNLLKLVPFLQQKDQLSI